MSKVKKLLAFAFLIGMATTAWADIPPPPVNQNLGIPDSVFNLLTASVCRTCHNQNPPAGIPVSNQYLPDRHHQHVGTIIDDPTAPEKPPYPDSDGDGVPDTNYACLNCHKLQANPTTGAFELNPEYRDCLRCHKQVGDPTVHHKTAAAQNGDCFACHGSLVAGIDPATLQGKGQPAPTYQPSMVTPWPSNKPNADMSITSSAGTHPGNCNFCHNTANGQPAGVDANGNPSHPLEPSSFGNILVFQNNQTHHGTGLPGQLGGGGVVRCNWCHVLDQGIPQLNSGQAIRVCERCHDRNSLHNIEFDADGNGIVPGQEMPYNGHIGNNANCWGCHGNNGQSASALADMNMAAATVPSLFGASAASVKQGVATAVTLIGNGFINSADPLGTGIPTVYQATVQVTDADGNVQVVTPSLVTPDTIEVTLPGNLAIGGAMLQAKKANQLSNPIPVVVKEQVTLTAAYCYSKYNVAVILGSGLSEYLPAVDSGTSVSVNGQPATWVYRWANGMIAAQVAQCSDSFQVSNVNGSATVPSITF